MEQTKKSWFRRHWIISIILSLIFLGFIISIFGDSNIENNPSGEQDNLVNVPESSGLTSNGKLEILSHKLDYGDYGNLIISGTAKNVAGRELSYASIDVKFYDSDGAVIGTSLDNINNLGNDEIWKFEVYYLGMDTYNVDDYSIEVGSTW